MRKKGNIKRKIGFMENEVSELTFDGKVFNLNPDMTLTPTKIRLEPEITWI